MKLYNPFARPDYMQAVKADLDNARLDLLRAEATLEHSQAVVQMYKAKVARLEATLKVQPQGEQL